MKVKEIMTPELPPNDGALHMRPTTLDTAADNVQASGREYARQATHVAHEARLLKTLAVDAVEDGIYAAKRTIKRHIRDVEDLRDTMALRIKRAPFTTAAVALGAGIFLGMAVGWARKKSLS